ncbi:MAG TPA: hypothetical protein VN693_05720 [Rhodanobacteraceae bacterium]|nr:hypothetical protein [Rhodanobacteraceae bacterium]
MLLILSSELDLAADFLIARLIERRLPYQRLNAEELHWRGGTYEIGAGSALRCLKATDGTRIDLDDVSTVWYRRALHARASSTVDEGLRSFVIGEIRHFWEGALMAGQAQWVNPMDKVAVAEHKLFQLLVASEIGFVVPRTLVSSDCADLTKFVEEHSPVICKPVYHGLVVEREARFSAYTRRVVIEDLKDADSIAVSPVLLQQEVPRQADLRITFIGDAVFAVRIQSDEAGMVDWRKPGGHLTYTPFILDGAVEARCRAMLKHLGLVYGAFDFVEDAGGVPVFLEVNPTGEWAWLEDLLGLPMRDAFIDLFFGQAK